MLDLAGSSWIGVFAVLSSPHNGILSHVALLDERICSTFRFCVVVFSAIIEDAIDDLRRNSLGATRNRKELANGVIDT